MLVVSEMSLVAKRMDSTFRFTILTRRAKWYDTIKVRCRYASADVGGQKLTLFQLRQRRLVPNDTNMNATL